jgi:uncharacterized membrane protein
MNQEMDKTQDKMNYVNKKLSTMLKTNDMGTIYTICCLSFILLILVILVIMTWREDDEVRGDSVHIEC